MTAYLNLGTNIGDRLSNLEQAVALIELHTGEHCRMSGIIESDPWGYYSPNKFLNIGIALQWSRTPIELLDITQEIERIMGSETHRDRRGGYIDRLIDIDIIAIDGVTLDTPRLTLPHPRAHLRPFVLIPLNQLRR